MKTLNEEKQIKEMAKIVSNAINMWGCEAPPISKSQFVATAIYCAGYRKQIDGEWNQQMRPYDDFIVCSSCGEWFNLIDNCTEKFKFCPNCGARMKGE